VQPYQPRSHVRRAMMGALRTARKIAAACFIEVICRK
jgi:hypothetical protein